MRGWGAIGGVLVALLVPATAGASTQTFTQPAASYTTATVHGTHGYRITVSGGADDISLQASKGEGGAQYYSLDGSTDGDRLEADLGRFGRISLGFTPTGDPVPQGRAHGCTGAMPTKTKGELEGTIRFRGEGGYTSIDRTALTAIRYDFPEQKCTFHVTKHPPKQSHGLTSFTAFKKTDRGSVTLSALSLPGEAAPISQHESIFFSDVLETVGRVAVDRFAIRFGNRDEFTFAKDKKTAQLSPAGIFSGAASYDRAKPRARRLSGNLVVDVPGGRPVRLAGPGFSSGFDKTGFGLQVVVSTGGWTGYARAHIPRFARPLVRAALRRR